MSFCFPKWMGGSSVKAESLPLCLHTEIVWAICTWQLTSDCFTSSLGSPSQRGYSHCGLVKIMQSNAGGIFKVTFRCNSGNFEKVSVVVCKMAINNFLPCVLVFATLSIEKSISLLLDSGFDYVTCFDHCDISKHDTSRDLKSTGTLRYTNSCCTGPMRIPWKKAQNPSRQPINHQTCDWGSS